MSQQNVAFTKQFLAEAPDDMVTALRNEEERERLREVLAPAAHPDFETVMIGPEYDPTPIGPFLGFDGLLEAWDGWFGPWAEFRVDFEELLDAGDRVVVLARQRGRIEPGGSEITTQSAMVITWRDERVARMEFFYDRKSAIKSAGLDPAASK